MRHLRPETPRPVFEHATFRDSILSLFWRNGRPSYVMSPPQDLGLPAEVISNLLNYRWGALSRRRRRLILRWLKDYRA